MSVNPVNGWDMLVTAASETTFGTTPVPASTAAYTALAVESIDCDLGGAEVGVIRPKQDRSVGRGMQSGWVEGRVQPLAWTFDTSLKSRAAVDTASPLLVFLKSAGLLHTVNAASNVTITSPGDPSASAFASMTLQRFLGQGSAPLAETLRGCVAKSVSISGAAGELLAKFSGMGIGKSTALSQAGAQGRVDSVTCTNVATSLTLTAGETARLGIGYYLIESEIVLVTAATPGTTTATITRAQLGTVAVAHTAAALVPYRPPAPTYAGSPISEPTSTVSFGSVIGAMRCRSWSIDITTGIDLLEPETGSRYSQGWKYTRTDAKVKVQLVLSADQASLFGMAAAHPTGNALAISQGVGVGGIFTFNAPNAELQPFKVPAPANDISIVDVEFRLRDSTAGNDMFNIVLT